MISIPIPDDEVTRLVERDAYARGWLAGQKVRRLFMVGLFALGLGVGWYLAVLMLILSTK